MFFFYLSLPTVPSQNDVIATKLEMITSVDKILTSIIFSKIGYDSAQLIAIPGFILNLVSRANSKLIGECLCATNLYLCRAVWLNSTVAEPL